MSSLEVRKDGLTTIFTINRPEKRNAINAEVADELQRRFAEFDASDQKVAIITGAGDNFSGGADLNDPPVLWRAYPTVGLKSDKPVITAVHGSCIGGAMVLVAMSDLCVASETTRFHYPEARYGLTGGFIATLASRIPHKFAMEVMLLGRPFSAQRAYEMGMVNQVTPAGQQLEAALEMARDLETMAPLVHRTLKRFVTEHALPHTPSELMARSQMELDQVAHSRDLKEGVAAFRERRVPTFTGV